MNSLSKSEKAMFIAKGRVYLKHQGGKTQKEELEHKYGGINKE